MAVGLLIGTEHLDDFDGYIKTIEAVGKIFDKFKSHFGTVKCFEIQEKFLVDIMTFGRLKTFKHGTRKVVLTLVRVYVQ